MIMLLKKTLRMTDEDEIDIRKLEAKVKTTARESGREKGKASVHSMSTSQRAVKAGGRGGVAILRA